MNRGHLSPSARLWRPWQPPLPTVRGCPGWLVLVCCSNPTLPTLPPSPTLQQRTSTDHWSRGTPDVDMTAGSSAPVPWRWGLSGGGGVGVCLAHHKQVTNTLISIQCIQYFGCGGWSAFQHHTSSILCFAHVYIVSLYTFCVTTPSLLKCSTKGTHEIPVFNSTPLYFSAPGHVGPASPPPTPHPHHTHPSHTTTPTTLRGWGIYTRACRPTNGTARRGEGGGRGRRRRGRGGGDIPRRTGHFA